MRPGLVEAEYFDIVEAGQYLGIVRPKAGDPDPVRTQRTQVQRLYQMIHRGRIPYLKIGKRVFFDKTTLDQWMRSGAHHTWNNPNRKPEPVKPTSATLDFSRDNQNH